MSIRNQARRNFKILQGVARTATFDLLGTPPAAPLMLFVELTRRCNSRCRHCDIWMGEGGEEVRASTLVDTFSRLARDGLVAVDLFGGEPLLRKDLTHIVAGAKAAKLHVTITTNGSLLTSAKCEELRKAGLDQLFVSIDGPTASLHDWIRGTEGSFKRATEGLRNMRELPGDVPRLGINTLVCRQNIGFLPEMVEVAGHTGATQIRLLPYHQCYPFNQHKQEDEMLLRKEDLRLLERSIREFSRRCKTEGIATNSASYLSGIVSWFAGKPDRVRCMAGIGVCDINAHGFVYPCYTHGASVGSIKEQPFEEIWRSPQLDRMRKDSRRCRGCWQSCYIEPGLRLSLRAAFHDWPMMLHDLGEYFFRRSR